MNSTMKNFLKKHYVDDTFYSHVSLLENEPGKFRFSRDNLENFWDIYCKIVVEDSNGVLGIAEKIGNYMQVIADFDIKLKLTDELVLGEHLYTEKNVRDIIGMYQSVLRTIIDGCTDDNLICVLLEKPIYSNTINNGKEVLTYLKNGFHLAFPNVFLKKTDIEMHLHPRLKNLLKEENVFENLGITDSSQLLDEHIVKSPWLLYGSRKSVDKDPYLLTKIFNSRCEEISLEKAFRYYKIYDTDESVIDINNNIMANLPRILSINPHYRQVNEIKPGIISPLKENMMNRNKNKNKEPQQMKVSVADALKTTSKLIPMLARFRCENYREWMEIGWILYNVGDGCDEALNQWINFSSNDNEKFDEDVCYTEWKKMIKKDLGLGTLKYYASIDNPELYAKFKYEEGQKSLKESIQGSHYDIAQILYNEYCTEFVCSSISNKIWYQYKNHHWEEIEEGVFLRNHISTDIVSRFTEYGHSLFSAVAASDKAEEKTFQERLKQTTKMISNLKSAPYKTCVMREAADLFFDKNFYKKLDTNPYLIAFKNGVYDLNENIFRNGKPEDYISKTMPINYVEFNETDDRIFAVHNFLEKIFPDTSVRQYFLDQASDVFLGGNQQKVVLFWTGEGDNGKSVTQNIFEKMLGEYAIKFSTTLLTGKKVANGAANPELARAGGGVRWAVLEEPDGDEEINIGYLKTLSGDDSYFVRDLFEKGKQTREIKPMFKLIFITNKLPRLKYADKATFNRIRVIPFESTFVRPGDPCPASYEEQLREKRFPMDREFNKKIPELVEAFAWVLLKHRQNITVRIEPEKVRVATAMYQKQNDSYRQFIEEKIMEEPDRYLLLSDLNSEFQDWYKQAYPRQQIPGKNELKEYFIKLWGDLDIGMKWKGYRIKTERDYKMANANAEEEDIDNIPEM
jgi:P4 family phage/plasmid primase-like protien